MSVISLFPTQHLFPPTLHLLFILCLSSLCLCSIFVYVLSLSLCLPHCLSSLCLCSIFVYVLSAIALSLTMLQLCLRYCSVYVPVFSHFLILAPLSLSLSSYSRATSVSESTLLYNLCAARRKIRLIEVNAKCCHPKNWPTFISFFWHAALLGMQSVEPECSGIILRWGMTES